MRRALRGLVATISLAAATTLAGCLDFDEQEVVVAYDGKRDQLDAQIVYRGLFSAGATKWNLFGSSGEAVEDVAGTEGQLDQLLAGRPLVGLFGPLPIDLVESRESKDATAAALARAITVDHGKFFRDASGRLCGWQHLRIRDVHAATELLDALMRELFPGKDGARDLLRSFGCDDEESGRRFETAVANKARWFEALDGALLWHVPASEAAARALADRIEQSPTLQSLLDAEAKRKAPPADVERKSAEGEAVRAPEKDARSEERTVFAALLHAFGVTSRITKTGVDLVLWEAGRAQQSVALRSARKDDRHWDLAPHLAKREVEVRTDVTAETLRSDFDERRAR